MKQLRKVQGQKGFTLVEIAIVLVIVGLVIFGVLKGAEMVKGAKAKKTIRQIEQLRTAIITYSDKYNGKLPGFVGGVDPAATAGVFEDMAKAGLIAYSAAAGMQNGFSGDVTAVVDPGGTKKIIITSKGVPSYVAAQIDTGLDDADPLKGDVKYTAGATGDALVDDLTIDQN